MAIHPSKLTASEGLDAFDIAKLHLVCRRLREITRDKKFWKQRCFEDSSSAVVQKRRDFQFIAPNLVQDRARLFEFQRRAQSLSSTSKSGISNGESSENGKSERSRAFADWDLTYTNEKVDWYEEYLARHAPISMSWLQQPANAQCHENREIRGLGCYDRGDSSLIVAPLDDGTLTVWRVGKQDVPDDNQGGMVVARSRPRLSQRHKNAAVGHLAPSKQIGPSVVECLSVDQVRNKAHVAVRNELHEIDLETLQISDQTRYPFFISALSDASYPLPLTVATAHSVHLHDPRERNGAWRSEADQSAILTHDTVALPQPVRDRNGLQADFQSDLYSPGTYARLSQPGPSSITHLPFTSGEHNTTDGYICVAGRFPSILTYSRRMFPRIFSTIHSGSRLASITSLPHPLLYSRSSPPSDPDAAHTIIACGEYNGKGSLELYPFSTSGQPNPPSLSSSDLSASIETPLAPVIPYQNRTSASSSKLLSVTPHGPRIVFSDGDGGLKWVERDGHSLVRRWNINAYTSSTISPSSNPNNTPGFVRNLFVNGSQEGDVARKILPVGPWEDSKGEIAVWTGERIGVLGFRPKPRFEWEWDRGDKEDKEEKLYAGRMRRALAMQADEVRFVRGLGGDR